MVRPITELISSTRGRLRPFWPYIKILVASALLVVIGLHIDWSAFYGMVDQIHVLWLLPVLVLVIGDRVFMAWKWWYLLRGLGVDANLVEVIFQYYLAGAVGTATQWGPSGDISRVVTVGGQTGRRSVVTASVILEKLGGLAATGALAATSIWVLTSRYELGQWTASIAAVGFVALLSAIIGVLAFWPPALDLMIRLGVKLPVNVVRDAMTNVAEATDAIRGTAAAPIFLCLTCVEQFVPLIVIFLLSTGLGAELSALEIVAVYPSIMFLSRLPLSLDAFGVREALFVFLFGLIGISTEVSFALTLADRIVTLAALGLGIAATWLMKRIWIQDTKDDP